MAITKVQSVVDTFGGSGGTTRSESFPSIPTDGDFILIGAVNNGSGVANTPAGFTALPPASNASVKLEYFYKIASGEVSSTYSITYTADPGFNCVQAWAVYRSEDTTTPLDVAAVTQNSNFSSCFAPSITPITDQAMHIGIVGYSDTVADTTPPGYAVDAVEPNLRLAIVSKIISPAAATGNVAVGSNHSNNGLSIALRPGVTGPPTAPGQVTGLTTTPKPGRADLSWTAPGSGGSAITDYLIERAPDVSGSPGTYATVTHSAQTTTTYTDTGLTNGSIYWYRISAINAVGTGTASTAVSVAPTANPLVASTTFEVGTSLGASNAIALPAGAVSGDLIIVHVNSDLNSAAGAITASTGWTAVTNGAQVQGTNVIGCNVFARVLDGSGSDALTVSGAAQDYVVNVIRITDHGVTQATINSTLFLTGTTGTTGNANPPSVNPATSNTWLWLAAMTLDLTTGNTITAAPSGYTMAENHVSASSTTSVAGAVAYKRSAAATSEDPGTFTNTSRAWIALSIAVPPSSTHVGGPVALAGQSDGVGGASGTLGTPHVPGPVALAGRADGVATVTGDLTVSHPGVHVFSDNFNRADSLTLGGPWHNLSDFGGATTPNPQLLSNMAQSNNNTSSSFATNYAAHGLTFTAGMQLDYDVDCSTDISKGGVGVGLFDSGVNGYYIFVGNAVHIYVLTAGVLQLPYLTNVGRPLEGTGTHEANHVTWTWATNGDLKVYLDGTLWSSINDTTYSVGAARPYTFISMYDDDPAAPSREATVDNFVLQDSITGPPPPTLAGQANGVSTATGTLAVARGLTGQSDGAATATGTLTVPGSQTVIFEPFTYANGALPIVSSGRWTGFGGANGILDAQVVSGHIQSLNNTGFHDNYLVHGMNVSGDWQIDFDCDAPLNIGAGGADVYLIDLATSKGYSVFIGNAVHVQAQTGSGSNNVTNVGRPGEGSGGHLANHVTFTHKANGDFVVYLDRVQFAAVNDTSQTPGPHLVVEPQSSNSPTFETTIDNLRLQNYIDLSRLDLYASSAGTSTATGTLSVARGLAGESDGTSTATGTLVHAGGPVALAGQSDGTSAVATPMLAVARAFAGESDGVAVVTTPTLAVARAFNAGSSGSGAITPPMMAVARGLVAESDGFSSASGTLGAPVTSLGGESDGTSTASAATVAVQRALSGSAAGLSTAVGSLGRLVSLSGQSDGSSTAVAGTLTFLVGLSGRSDGHSTASGDLNPQSVMFRGRADGVSTATGSLSVVRPFAGKSDGVGSALAALSRLVALSGASVGISAVTGSMLVHLGSGAIFWWDGTAWVPNTFTSPPIQIWNGRRWVDDPVVWNGLQWQPMNP